METSERLSDHSDVAISFLHCPIDNAIKYFGAHSLSILRTSGPTAWHDPSVLIPGAAPDAEIYMEKISDPENFFLESALIKKLINTRVLLHCRPPAFTPQGMQLLAQGVDKAWFLNRKLLFYCHQFDSEEIELIENAFASDLSEKKNFTTHYLANSVGEFGDHFESGERTTEEGALCGSWRLSALKNYPELTLVEAPRDLELASDWRVALCELPVAAYVLECEATSVRSVIHPNSRTGINYLNCPSSYKVGHQSGLSIGGSGSFV